MKISSYNSKRENLKVVVELLAQHQDFHKYLDHLASKTNDLKVIDLLIDIRSFNIACISKYTGLIARKHVEKPAGQLSLSPPKSLFDDENMTLWNIHGQLARFIPVYATAMRNKEISKVYRTIISNTYDQLIAMKEQLLHPVSAIEFA